MIQIKIMSVYEIGYINLQTIYAHDFARYWQFGEKKKKNPDII